MLPFQTSPERKKERKKSVRMKKQGIELEKNEKKKEGGKCHKCGSD